MKNILPPLFLALIGSALSGCASGVSSQEAEAFHAAGLRQERVEDVPIAARELVDRVSPPGRLRFIKSFPDDPGGGYLRSYTYYYTGAKVTVDPRGTRLQVFYRPPLGPRGDPRYTAARGPAVPPRRGIDLEQVPPALGRRFLSLKPGEATHINCGVVTGGDPDARFYDFFTQEGLYKIDDEGDFVEFNSGA